MNTKTPWKTPSLKTLGSIQELTQGNGSGPPDIGQNKEIGAGDAFAMKCSDIPGS